MTAAPGLKQPARGDADEAPLCSPFTRRGEEIAVATSRRRAWSRRRRSRQKPSHLTRPFYVSGILRLPPLITPAAALRQIDSVVFGDSTMSKKRQNESRCRRVWSGLAVHKRRSCRGRPRTSDADTRRASGHGSLSLIPAPLARCLTSSPAPTHLDENIISWLYRLAHAAYWLYA